MPQGDALSAETTRATLPLPEAIPYEAPRKITAAEREFKAYRALRDARATQRHAGARKLREAKVSVIIYLVIPVLMIACPEICRKRRRKQTRRSKYHKTLLAFCFHRYDMLCINSSKIRALLGPRYAPCNDYEHVFLSRVIDLFINERAYGIY